MNTVIKSTPQRFERTWIDNNPSHTLLLSYIYINNGLADKKNTVFWTWNTIYAAMLMEACVVLCYCCRWLQQRAKTPLMPKGKAAIAYGSVCLSQTTIQHKWVERIRNRDNCSLVLSQLGFDSPPILFDQEIKEIYQSYLSTCFPSRCLYWCCCEYVYDTLTQTVSESVVRNQWTNVLVTWW